MVSVAAIVVCLLQRQKSEGTTLISSQVNTCAMFKLVGETMVTPDSAADQPIESIEMTQNEVYGSGIPLTKGTGKEAAADTTMEENVGCGVTSDKRNFSMETSH